MAADGRLGRLLGSPQGLQVGDVGKQVAVFVSVEVKTAKGRASETQTVWLDAVKRVRSEG